jgi:hypothetical protein
MCVFNALHEPRLPQWFLMDTKMAPARGATFSSQRFKSKHFNGLRFHLGSHTSPSGNRQEEHPDSAWQ